MSLSSALYTGVSGLTTLGNAMTVIGDNIANVNTVGFKASRVTFQDVLSQHVATTAGTTQIGCGTALGDISSSFAQGSFESTDSATDLAINGEGFFVVRDPNNEENVYYTRAGEFRFDKDGNLVNPGGYIVRGNVLSEDTTGDIEDVGSITDIVLSSFTSPPSPTDQITVITNLDSDANSKAVSLSNTWDGTATTPIAATNYEYQSTVKVYDSLGSTHDITIYYDKVSGSTWEYIVTGTPSEDLRSDFANRPSAGLLARGTVSFSEAAGAITAMTMDRLGGVTGGHIQEISGENYGGLAITSSDTTITINNYQALTADGSNFELTWNGDTTSWSITGNAGYASAAIVASDGDQVTINLDGAASPATDITVDFASTLGVPTTGSITSFTQSVGTAPPAIGTTTVVTPGDIDATGTTTFTRAASTVAQGAHGGAAIGNVASMVLNNEEEAYKDTTGNFVLDWDNGTTTWSITSNGGYTGAAVTGDANSVTVDLDGGAVADITTTFAAPLAADATVEFTLDGNNWTAAGPGSAVLTDNGTTLGIDFAGGTTADVTVAYSGGRWANTDQLTMVSVAHVSTDTLDFDITGTNMWTTATPNTSGYLVFQPDFLGGTATAMDIELDFGSHEYSSGNWENDALSSTQFARASTTTFQSANGYGAGDIQSVTVGTDGVITGKYSNGQVIPLYRVALAKFQNQQGLSKEGGNLFKETLLSGNPVTNIPGTSGLGTILPNSLEQSNVDLATEFVKMITTQRGFQANSKIITVTDQMLAELINLKR